MVAVAVATARGVRSLLGEGNEVIPVVVAIVLYGICWGGSAAAAVWQRWDCRGLMSEWQWRF